MLPAAEKTITRSWDRVLLLAIVAANVLFACLTSVPAVAIEPAKLLIALSVSAPAVAMLPETLNARRNVKAPLDAMLAAKVLMATFAREPALATVPVSVLSTVRVSAPTDAMLAVNARLACLRSAPAVAIVPLAENTMTLSWVSVLELVIVPAKLLIATLVREPALAIELVNRWVTDLTRDPAVAMLPETDNSLTRV
jgi:hypothetical protein